MQVRAQWSLLRLPSRSLSYAKICIFSVMRYAYLLETNNMKVGTTVLQDETPHDDSMLFALTNENVKWSLHFLLIIFGKKQNITYLCNMIKEQKNQESTHNQA